MLAVYDRAGAELALNKNPEFLWRDSGLIGMRAWQFPTFAQVFCTIIGAKRFHFRGRDGIGWFPLALAARQNWLSSSSSEESGQRTLASTVCPGHTQTPWVLYGQASRAISIG